MAELLMHARSGLRDRPDTATGDDAARRYLHEQAVTLRVLGSPFAAAVLDAARDALHRAPRCHSLIADWPGDRSAAALGQRLAAALHAVARAGDDADLATLFRRGGGDVQHIVGDALARHDAVLAARMAHPTQTNEVARTGTVMAALMVAGHRFGLPFELFEVGASAGLNLNLGHYAHRLGGASAGDAHSRVVIAPTWIGADPPAYRVEITQACGVDIDPIDATAHDAADRLLSYVFADQRERSERLCEALLTARRFPPRVEQGRAGNWLPHRLQPPQRPGLCRVVLHSMVLQYLSDDERAAIRDSLQQAGSRATLDRPLAVIGLEWTRDRSEVQLRLTCWPGGDERVLAVCHPYGSWIDWRG